MKHAPFSTRRGGASGAASSLFNALQRISPILGKALSAVLMVIVILCITFLVVELPPGDFVDGYISKRAQGGFVVTETEAAEMRSQLGLDKPVMLRFARWISRLVKGDLGYSWEYRRPVGDVIAERTPITIALLAFTTLAIYGSAVVLGMLYVLGGGWFVRALDALALTGLATPNFIVALALMFILSSSGIIDLSRWSTISQQTGLQWARTFFSLVWIPVFALAWHSLALHARTIRAAAAVEEKKEYYVSLRLIGISRWRIFRSYLLRPMLIPTVSTLGWDIAAILSGTAVVSAILGTPDLGSVLVTATSSGDLYLSAGIVLFFSLLVLLGTQLSRLFLAWITHGYQTKTGEVE